jgi:hypothetical protein
MTSIDARIVSSGHLISAFFVRIWDQDGNLVAEHEIDCEPTESAAVIWARGLVQIGWIETNDDLNPVV